MMIGMNPHQKVQNNELMASILVKSGKEVCFELPKMSFGPNHRRIGWACNSMHYPCNSSGVEFNV